MSPKLALTTGNIAAHCHISPDTVINWIKDGKLKAYTTPGGHRRVHLADFKDFLAEHDLPPYGDEAQPARKILVVDDEPQIVQLITRSLTNPNFEFATAEDGFDAGLMMVKFKPDLILLDLMMPNIDGFKVCQRIKSDPATKHIGILVITGYDSEGNIQKALDCGADDYLGKPFAQAELAEKVDYLFRQPPAASLSA